MAIVLEFDGVASLDSDIKADILVVYVSLLGTKVFVAFSERPRRQNSKPYPGRLQFRRLSPREVLTGQTEISPFRPCTGSCSWSRAFASGVLIYALNRRLARLGHAAVALSAAGVAMAMLVAYAIGVASRNLAAPSPQRGFGLVALPLGRAIGRSLLAGTEATKRVLLASVAMMTLITSLVLIKLGYTSAGIPYSLAIVLVSLVYCWQTNGNSVVAALAPLTVCISGLLALGLMKTWLRKFV